MKWHWAALFLLLLAPNSSGQEAPQPLDGGTQPWVYPFVEKGHWGYITQTGEWLIPPRFDEVGAETRGDLLPFRQGQKWGLIDRSSAMLLKPQFDYIRTTDGPIVGYSGDGENQRHTLLAPSGTKIEQVTCDWLGDFSEGAAWARRGKYIGLLSETGEWKVAPKIPWGAHNALPEKLDHGVSWFERDKMLWGLIGKDGRVLLKPVVGSYVRYEKHSDGVESYQRKSQPWSDGKTWVQVGDRWKLITLEGQELASVRAALPIDPLLNEPVKLIQRWGDLPCFAAPVWEWSSYGEGEALLRHLTMVGFDGKIYLDADIDLTRFHALPSPDQILSTEEGSDLAKVPWDKLPARMMETFTAPDGSIYRRKTWFENGCALYQRTVHTPPRDIQTVVALDFDRKEHFQLPDAFDDIDPLGWSEGLAAAVTEIHTQRTMIYGTGFVDTTGKVIIPPKYGYHAEPFFRGLAWVPQQGNQYVWGLIDRSGKQILPFEYANPGRPVRSAEYPFPPSQARMDAWLRFHDLIIIFQNGEKGLATPEGKVVLPPEYNHFGDLVDGRAVVTKYDKTLHQQRYGTIDREGKLVIPTIYMGMSPFCKGVAWARDAEGLKLIDTQGKVLSSGDYACLLGDQRSWEWENPFARDALCCISKSPDTYQQKSRSWGWMDEKGHIVRWSEEDHPRWYQFKRIPGDH